MNTANSAENENLEYFRPMGKIETTPEEVHVQEDKRIMEILKEYGK